jgi:hypothetical protein
MENTETEKAFPEGFSPKPVPMYVKPHIPKKDTVYSRWLENKIKSYYPIHIEEKKYVAF